MATTLKAKSRAPSRKAQSAKTGVRSAESAKSASVKAGVKSKPTRATAAKPKPKAKAKPMAQKATRPVARTKRTVVVTEPKGNGRPVRTGADGKASVRAGVRALVRGKMVMVDAAAAPSRPVVTAYSKALDFLNTHTDYERMRIVRYNTTTFNLDRMRTLLKHLGNPHLRLKTAHVAGTKGKGSTCHMLAAMCQAGGLKTGLYTSPHLVDIRERVQINGEMISPQALVDQVRKIEPILRKMAADRPTFFEIFTALSFNYFAQQKVDIAVIETGLGGRLDSTNVLLPEVTAITSISKDHMQVLGNTLSKIAEEKAGIYKKDVPALTCVQEPEVLNVLRRVATHAGTNLEVVGTDIEFSYRFEAMREMGPHMRVSLSTERSRFEHLAVPLLGEHQAVNCGLALAMFDKLRARGLELDEAKALQGLANVKLPGRLEMINNDPRLIIDGAHNAASLQALFKGISQHISYDSMVVIFGCNCDKDIDGMLERVSLGADKVIFTRARSNPKAADANELANLYTERYGKMAQVAQDFTDALDIAERAVSREDLIVVTGSFYLIGEAKQRQAERVAAARN
jgi:dihydrofolate synthase/folylpolyglutamate synthase